MQHSQKHLKLKDRSTKARTDTDDKDDEGGLSGYVDGKWNKTLCLHTDCAL